MFDLAIKNILARKTRSLLCILAVMVSVYLNGSTATMNNWMYTTMTSELVRYMGKIYVQQGGSSYLPFDSSIADTTAREILAHEDLNSAQSTSLMFVRLARGMMPFMPAQAMVIGVTPGKESALWGRVEAASGASAFASDERGDVAILGEEAAGYFGARVGDDIAINNTSVRVIGVLQRSSMDSVNIAAVVPLASTMVMAVFERTREIGTLRAIGANARTILVTVFAEIVMLTLVGGIPGAILTLPMATMMNTILPSPAQLAQIVLLAVVAGALGGLYPAWRAARVNPLEALRYE